VSVLGAGAARLGSDIVGGVIGLCRSRTAYYASPRFRTLTMISDDRADRADATPPRAADPAPPLAPREVGGRSGPEPTRYGDWEKNGRCIDF
jgi:hypothetical protein